MSAALIQLVPAGILAYWPVLLTWVIFFVMVIRALRGKS